VGVGQEKSGESDAKPLTSPRAETRGKSDAGRGGTAISDIKDRALRGVSTKTIGLSLGQARKQLRYVKGKRACFENRARKGWNAIFQCEASQGGDKCGGRKFTWDGISKEELHSAMFVVNAPREKKSAHLTSASRGGWQEEGCRTGVRERDGDFVGKNTRR